ncbi:hypothetical protein BDN72DRAFT_866006 [Pluteus cervinus]|uniref:Uncharacterized protein n=1 Tax=Pluteus cervinus TaxID=181527 RepID=A0ACD2ZY19_9AGAR|nr:hypothetical protein BDN72DRAFT_866006 [Pluteus cervinus]
MAIIPDGHQIPATHSAASTMSSTSSKKCKVAEVLSTSEDEGSGTPTIVDSESEDGPLPSPARSDKMEVTPPSTRGRSRRSTGRNAVSLSPVGNHIIYLTVYPASRKHQRRHDEDPALEQESHLEGLSGEAYRAKHHIMVVEIPTKRGRGRPPKSTVNTTSTKPSTASKRSKAKGKAKQVEVKMPSLPEPTPSASTSSSGRTSSNPDEDEEFFTEDQALHTIAPPVFSTPLPLSLAPPALPAAILPAITPASIPVVAQVLTGV